MTDVVSSQERDSRSGSSDGVQTVTASEDRTIAYVEHGAPTGRPVVLLHGTPGSRVLGELFDDAARQRGVRLLSLDRPGYGRSDPWPERTLTDTGEFVAAVLDDAEVSNAGVVGFSGGGPHALAVAATHPELVSGVDVVSCSPPPSLTEGTPRVQRLLETVSSTAPRLMKALVRGQAWLAVRTSPGLVVSQYTSDGGGAEVPHAAAEVVRRDFVEAVSNGGNGLVTESGLLANEWDFEPSEIDVPVYLWHGSADANAPIAGVRRLADALPNARLTELEDIDHLNALCRCRRDLLDRCGRQGET